jgi:hypothetical protein
MTKMTAMRQQILACLMLVLLSAFGNAPRAQEAQVAEAELKAAFLFNFTKFIEWPSDAFPTEASHVVVGVYGDEPFAGTLRSLLADKKAHGRPFTVKRLANPQDAKHCQIIFFRESETRKMREAYESIKRLPILTVGESDDFLDEGGMFNLFFEDKQLRFEVNPATAENAKLTVSSKLLRLAKKIRKGGAK